MGEMARESLKAQTPGRRKARALPGVPCWSSWRGRQHTGTEGWIPRPSRPGSWAGCGHNAPLAYLSQLSHIACIANCPWSGHAGEGPPRQPLCTPGPMSWAGLPSWGASRGALYIQLTRTSPSPAGPDARGDRRGPFCITAAQIVVLPDEAVSWAPATVARLPAGPA
jgi:hypothetical protein